MNRDQLAHLLRAGGQVLDVDSFIVVGSAALLGSFPDRLLGRTAKA